MNKIFIRTIIFLAVTLAADCISFAVPSRDGKHPGPKEAVRPREVTQVYDEKTKTMRAIRKSGAIKVAVIPVQFTSAGTQNSGSYSITAQNLLDMTTNLISLKNFYNEVSYGTVDIQLTVVFSTFQQTGTQQINGTEMCITLHHPMSYYADTPASIDYADGGGQAYLLQDAISSAAVTSSNFDVVIVVHAGYGNESTYETYPPYNDNLGDIWSVQVDLGEYQPPLNVGGFSYGIVVPMMEYPSSSDGVHWTIPCSPRGVICHEFGHYLGLPDMYNTSSTGGATVVGYWCLMDAGEWSNNGFDPTHPSAWCKQYLGLVSPNVVSSKETVSGVLPVEISSSSVYRFNIPDNSLEYFLVCFSTISAYGKYQPGTGVLIWHVDEGVINGKTFDTRISNNEINCYSTCTVTMVPAGNTSPSKTYGSQSDAWPGIKTVFTAPYSNSYTGLVSSITLSSFLLSSSAASFYADVKSTTTSTNQPIVTAAAPVPRVYPNPFKPSVHHNGITFENLSAGAKIRIFDITGVLVLELVDSNDAGKINWNARNGSGAMLASGVYIAYIKGSTGTTIIKFAIIR